VSFLRHPRAFVRELCAVDPTARPPTGRRP
jgi:hypothetical protein